MSFNTEGIDFSSLKAGMMTSIMGVAMGVFSVLPFLDNIP
jgi:hypothetical protein